MPALSKEFQRLHSLERKDPSSRKSNGGKSTNDKKSSSMCDENEFETQKRFSQRKQICTRNNIVVRTSHKRKEPNSISETLSCSDGYYKNKLPFSISSNRSVNCSSTRRRRFSLTAKNQSNKTISEEVDEDVFVPLNCTSSFQRLRQEILLDQQSCNGQPLVPKSVQQSKQRSEKVSRKYPTNVKSARTQQQPRLYSRCGDWVRIFPFNAATLHGSQDCLYVKTLVSELHKYKRTCEKVFKENPDASSDFLDCFAQKHLWRDHHIWSPNK